MSSPAFSVIRADDDDLSVDEVRRLIVSEDVVVCCDFENDSLFNLMTLLLKRKFIRATGVVLVKRHVSVSYYIAFLFFSTRYILPSSNEKELYTQASVSRSVCYSIVSICFLFQLAMKEDSKSRNKLCMPQNSRILCFNWL